MLCCCSCGFFCLFVFSILSDSCTLYILSCVHLCSLVLVLQVKEGFEHVSTQLSEVKAALTESQQREKQSGSLVQELTAMVKEQKARIAELAKDKQDAIKELKVGSRLIFNLELLAQSEC